MKRILGVLLSVVMLVSMSLPTASAAGTPTVSISSGQVKPGGSVTLTVSIEDNPGLAVCMLYLYYDTDVFDVEPDTDLSAAGKFGETGSIISNSIVNAKKTGNYNGDLGKDGVVSLWYNSSGVNTAGDGAIMKIRLKAKADSYNGDYTVSVGYSPENTSNEDGEPVKLNTKTGVITLSGGKTSSGQTTTTETPKETPQFPDAQGHWAQEYIEKAAKMGLILGNEHGMYMPDKTMTRAECVTILWRACGSPKATKNVSFTDLDPNQKWYHEAVAWSAENGIIKGTGDGTTFDPLGTVNRDQLATILFRMSGGKSGMEGMLSGIYNDTYPDSDMIADWAKQGVYWSIYNNILCGENSVNLGTQLKPTAAADRAQIAVMIVRHLEMY